MTTIPDTNNHTGAVRSANNTAGRVSLIIGIAATVLGTVFFVVQTNLTFTVGYELMNSWGLVSNAVIVLISLAGLGFGIAGAVQRSKPQLAAGIGIGIAAVMLTDVLVSTVVFAVVAAIF
ncbi:hypothetical protein I6E52_10615 [Salinibacterium sp. NG253]|uniref:hypothetical protein n=1 Tax=Salinibacterium sp. NG253 TaxID=2792039 RepID=UPI0018CEB134|nr:hypothetical protein [Salinibacterium sp. NG253]MBH0117295.1 hypothetical protein [Salinibacterium sp. NG253]